MLENLYPINADGKQIGTTPTITYFGNTSDYFRDPRTPEIAETDYAKTPSAILQAKQAIALARYAGADRDATAELNEAESLLRGAEMAQDAGRDSDSVDIAARKSISASVRAEALALQRKEARDQRNERTRTDAEIRAAENKFSNAQEQIDNLKAELARETRNRELAEREAMTYSTQLKEARQENGKLREDLVRIRLDAESANAKLAAIEEEREKQSKEEQVKESEGALISSLRTFGSVAKNDRGIVLTLPENIWNGTRSSDLLPAADGKLTSLAEILAANPDYRITVEAHTDNRGDPEAVQTVTDRRSYVLADKFSTLGVAEGRIVAKGFGASVPVVPNTTNANRAKNRRLQIVLSPNL
jgi:outer membrane protein OmpA-like peptidoglycan-associated protein